MIEPSSALARIIAGESLSASETEELFGSLMDGELGEATKAALLAALATRGETVEEIVGAARAMRRRVVSVTSHRSDLVDTCGTGGDAKGTFNISTAAAIVAAAAGVPVAKHGNRAVSSRSGSADVLEALGVNLDVEPEEAAQALDRIGLAFLFAPRLHPAMREVMPVRRELGVRTLFNLLGPLTNPADSSRQVVGVYADSRVEPMAEALARLGCRHGLVVHGSDGLDELTTTGPSRVAEVRAGRVEGVWMLDPAELGLARAEPGDLEGGEPERNALLLEHLLAGEPGPLADISTLNAAAAIYVGGRASGLREGLELARRTLAEGAAERKLDELRKFRPE